MKFADIPFHEDVKARLRLMVDTDRLPHALLLQGPSGVGKFMLARAVAQYLHCTDRSDGEPCGKCPSCRQHAGFNNIDMLFSFPVVKKEGSSQALSSDYMAEFRDFVSESPFMDPDRWSSSFDKANAKPQFYVEEGAELIRRLSYTNHSARYKVVIFWLPERMNEQTANKLLKLVEEPSDDTKFIFVSNNPSEVLPTIYSRTQRIDVRRYSDEELAQWLQAEKGLGEEDATSVAHLAEGNINRACTLLKASRRSRACLDFFIRLMRMAYLRDVAGLRAWSNELAKEGREAIMTFFEYATRMLRENFIYALRVDRLNYMNPEEAAFSSRFAPFVNERNVEQLMLAFEDAYRDIAGNANAKIVCFDLAIKVILLLRQ
ncbi:MAG: DNA polymerase III subunit delta' [Muribaculaceae bacterium]|nr:DNA polymerase III subunit delta' [Muribaculaceae bacterium]